MNLRDTIRPQVSTMFIEEIQHIMESISHDILSNIIKANHVWFDAIIHLATNKIYKGIRILSTELH